MIRLFKKLKKWGYTQLAKITPGTTATKGAIIIDNTRFMKQ